MTFHLPPASFAFDPDGDNSFAFDTAYAWFDGHHVATALRRRLRNSILGEYDECLAVCDTGTGGRLGSAEIRPTVVVLRRGYEERDFSLVYKGPHFKTASEAWNAVRVHGWNLVPRE
jgi:hypothetical protein